MSSSDSMFIAADMTILAPHCAIMLIPVGGATQ